MKHKLRSPLGVLGVLSEDRAMLAAEFMSAFRSYQRAARGRSFVDFVCALDSSVTHANYKGHRAYVVADYLRRLDRQRGNL